MRGCLSSACFSSIVNKRLRCWFVASRGVRQGHPLSPFLFTMVADVLSRMFCRGVGSGVLMGSQWGGRRLWCLTKGCR